MTFKLQYLILACMLTGCAGAGKKFVKENHNDRYESELYLLRKQITAVERTNSILEEENMQDKKMLKERDAHIGKLQTELDSLKARYEKEMALWDQKYDNVVRQFALLEKQSGVKIAELSELNKKLETELGSEIRRLSDEMNRKENDRARELEKAKKDAAEKEYALAGTIKEANEKIAELKDRVLERESQVRDRDRKIGELGAELDKLMKSRDELEKNIDRLRGELQDSMKKAGEIGRDGRGKP